MEPRPFRRGNAAPCSVSRLTTTRFNGATSFQTWKRAEHIEKIHGTDAASMEPRPFRRGNAIPRVWKLNALNPLQWSHVLSDVETPRGLRLAVPLHLASMEPRP